MPYPGTVTSRHGMIHERAQVRGHAITSAVAWLSDGLDWEEVRMNLLENELLFPDIEPGVEVSEEDAEECMSIIRAAERRLGWS